MTSGDCDDSDATVYPLATELCDGQDNNCNNSLPSDEVDSDGDNHVACTLDTGGWDGTGSVVAGVDCNESDATIYTGATELCDGLDNDCDSSPPVMKSTMMVTTTWSVASMAEVGTVVAVS